MDRVTSDEVRAAHDATGNHKTRVRPLPAEDRVDFNRLAGKRHALLVGLYQRTARTV